MCIIFWELEGEYITLILCECLGWQGFVQMAQEVVWAMLVARPEWREAARCANRFLENRIYRSLEHTYIREWRVSEAQIGELLIVLHEDAARRGPSDGGCHNGFVVVARLEYIGS